MIQWLIDNWLEISIPVLVIIACYAVGLWPRKVVNSTFEGWTRRAKWEGSQLVLGTAHCPFLFWFLLLGVGITVQVSVLPARVQAWHQKDSHRQNTW